MLNNNDSVHTHSLTLLQIIPDSFYILFSLLFLAITYIEKCIDLQCTVRSVLTVYHLGNHHLNQDIEPFQPSKLSLWAFSISLLPYSRNNCPYFFHYRLHVSIHEQYINRSTVCTHSCYPMHFITFILQFSNGLQPPVLWKFVVMLTIN